MTSLEILIKFIEIISKLRDPYENGHGNRVRELSLKIAKKFNYSEEELAQLSNSATLHDVGKMLLDDRLLNKLGRLTALQKKSINDHSYFGAKILRELGIEYAICNTVEQHHERWDGSGYPKGLRGIYILQSARIISVADSFDAMTSPRPYRVPKSKLDAIKEIKTLSGTLYDPDVVEKFIEIMATEGING